MAPFAAGHERWLVERGFRPGALPHRISQFACLSRWLEAEGLSAGELDPERVEEFLAARRSRLTCGTARGLSLARCS